MVYNTKKFEQEISKLLCKSLGYDDQEKFYEDNVGLIESLLSLYKDFLATELTLSSDTLPNIDDIEKFYSVGSKKNNKKDNDIREAIIANIINKKIPLEYYEQSDKWSNLRKEINTYIKELKNQEKINEDDIQCIRRGERNNNYDFDFIMGSEKTLHIEFKYNADSISDIPQFVQKGKPSTFFNFSYEYFYLENYFSKLCERNNLVPPSREEYKISNTKPPCLKYFEHLKEEAESIGTDSIKEFIRVNELDKDKLTSYLVDSQKDKIYMFYKNGKINYYKAVQDDYVLKDVKAITNNSYIFETKTGKKIKVLLRWKNGKGWALPALQIGFSK